MNQNLADELVTMMAEDQRLLQQLFDSGELPSESYHPRMKVLHEQNVSRLKEIVGAHGWPTPFHIEDSATVNERRARLGLNSLEERQEQMTEQERKRRANIEQTS